MSEADNHLAIDAALKLAHLLRNDVIPEAWPKAAAAQGMPIITTVWGDELRLPLVGPGYDEKPYPTFVWLEVYPGDTKCTGHTSQSSELVEFVTITARWAVVGATDKHERSPAFLNFGVRVGIRRGEMFYRGASFAKE